MIKLATANINDETINRSPVSAGLKNTIRVSVN